MLLKKKELKEKIKKAEEKNKRIVKVVEELKKSRIKTLKEKEQLIEKGLVLKENQIYVSEKRELRVEII